MRLTPWLSMFSGRLPRKRASVARRAPKIRSTWQQSDLRSSTELLERRTLLTTQILDFNGLPFNTAFGSVIVEDGFRVQDNAGGLRSNNSANPPWQGVQGGTLYENGIGATVGVARVDGGNFRFNSIQLNSLNSFLPTFVPFTATFSGGGGTSFSFTTDGNFNTFETFNSPTTSNLSLMNWQQVSNAGDYHQFDNISLEIGPTISGITPVSPDPRTTNVSAVAITFNEAVDLSSFTFADITLTRDGNPVALDSSVTMSLTSGTTYSINGLSAFTSTNGSYVLTANALNILGSTGLQGAGTSSDSWTRVAPLTVTSTSPSLASGTLTAGTTSTQISFSNDVIGGATPSNFELRNQGADGILGNGDDAIISLGASYVPNTTTLTFAGLTEGIYRLTALDNITDQSSNMIDGDANGTFGGNWVRDFVVVPSAPLSFSRSTISATGSDGRESVKIVDVNNDGNADVVFVGFANNTVSVALGNGAGGLGTFNTFSSQGSSPITCAVADFTGDGKPDIAVGNRGSGTIQIFVGNGGGGFSPGPNTFPGNLSPQSIAAGDFNGDGKTDLAVANLNDGSVSILINNGTGAFGQTMHANTGIGASSVAVGFLNGDSNLDLIVSDSTATVNVFFGNGAGGSSSSSIVGVGGSRGYSAGLAVVDVNNDGKADIVSANAGSSNLGVLLGNGAGGFFLVGPINVAAGLSNMTIADFDSDGNLDVALVPYAGTSATILLGTGAGNFISGSVLISGGGYADVEAITAGDLNNDGKPDLLITSFYNSVLIDQYLNTTTQSPFVIYGQSGFRFNVDTGGFAAGQLIQGTGNAFDGVNRLQVGGADYSPSASPSNSDSGRTLITGAQTLAGLSVSREITIPNSGSQDFARTVDVFNNPTGSPITTTVKIVGNLGTDAATVVFGTSNGDTTVETSDQWIGTDDADGTGSPAIIHYIHGPGGLAPTTTQVVGDNIYWTYDLTVPAGQTVRLESLTILATTRAAAISAASTLVTGTGFGGQAAAFLSAGEIASLANFAFGPSVNLSVGSASGTEAGTTAITVTVTAGAAVTGDQTVTLGVSGTGITAGDYALSGTTITIPNGQTTGTVTFTVKDDILNEGNETAILTISNPSAGISLGATTTANITITDDDNAGTSNFTVPSTGTYRVVLTGGNTIEIRDSGNNLITSRPLGTDPLVINGTAGNDVLTLDYSGGNPIPSGGLTFNGGGQSGDAIRIVGTGLAAAYTPNATTPGNGTIIIGGRTITFTGLAPVDYDVVGGTFTLTLPGANDIVDISNSTLIDGSTLALKISGSSGGVAFENARVRGSAIVIDTTTVAGADTITITSGNVAHLNTDLTVNTGAEAGDTVQINGAFTVSGAVSLTSENVNSTAGGIVTTGTGLTVSNTGTASTLTGVIHGAGGLTKQGAGTLALSGTNDYTGTTAISQGILSITTAAALGATGATNDTTVANGASLRLNASGTTFAAESLTITGPSGQLEDAGQTNVWAGQITLAGGADINVSNASVGSLNVTGKVTGSGGFDKTGGGHLRLSNNSNDYTGVTSVNQGQLELAAANALGATGPGNETTVANSANLLLISVPSVDTVYATEDLTLTGPNGRLENNNTNNTWTGQVTLSGGSDIYVYSGTLTITGKMTGSGGFDLSGFSSLTLSNTANDYTGSTNIQTATTLKLGASGVIPDGSSVVNNGLFNLNGHDETIDGLSGSTTVDNTVAGGPYTLTVGFAGATSSFSGVIKNTAGSLALTKIGAGTLTLSGPNTYTGATTVSAGKLRATGSLTSNVTANSTGTFEYGANNVLADANTLSVTASGAKIDIVTFSDTVGGVQITDGTLAGTTGVLTSTTAFDVQGGAISAKLAGSVGLNKTGASAATLSSVSTYTGATAVSVGKLTVSGSLTSNVTASGTGTFEYGANDVLANANTLAVTAAGAKIDIVTFSDTVSGMQILDGTLAGTTGVLTSTTAFDVQGGAISAKLAGSVGLNKTGAAAATLSSVSTYTGATAVSVGKLTVSGSLTSNVTASGTGTFEYGASNVLADANTLAVTAAGAKIDIVTFSDTVSGMQILDGTLAGTTGVLTSTTAFDVQGGAISAKLAGSVGLNKTGASAATLSSVSTYTGATAVSVGKLTVSGSLTSNVTASGTGTFEYGANDVLANANTLAVTAAGAKIDIVTFTDTVGGVQITAGSLAGTTGVLSSTTAFDVQAGSISAKLAGSVGLNKTGAGTATLSSASTYTGTTTVSAGNLTVTGSLTSNVTASGTGTFEYGANDVLANANTLAVTAAGATIDIKTFTDTVGGVQITAGSLAGTTGVLTSTSTIDVQGGSISAKLAGAVGLNKTGAGTATLASASTYTGTTTITNGTLLVNGSITSSVTVTSPGILGGTGGTITGSVSGTGTVSPGSSPGILNVTGTFGPVSTLVMELTGASAGVGGYDQVNVIGGVNLTGTTLSPTLTFSPAFGSTLTIISNDTNSDLVTGTFVGLPEGKVFTIGSGLFQISYTGGDGNDVVLTTLNPAVPIYNGTPGTDTFIVTYSGGNVVTTLNGNQIDSRLVSSITGVLAINGLAGTDSLTVNFTGGNPVPSNGLNYDGGPGSDSLATLGGNFLTGSDHSTGAGAGVLSYSGGTTGAASITYSNLTPIIDDNVVTNFTIDGLATADDIIIENAAGSRTIVREAANLFESIAFMNKTNVTVNGLNGVDTITLADNSTPATGLASLTVDTGATAGDAIVINNNLAFSAGTLTLTAPGISQSSGAVSLTTLNLNGAVSQTGGSVAVSGTTTITAGAGLNASLTQTGNNFATVVITSGQDVDLDDAGAVTFGNVSLTGNLTIDAGAAVALNGTTTVGGNLDVQADANAAAGGAISGTGVITITGTATLSTGTPATATNDITLNNTANNFIGNVTITSANDASLDDANTITFGNVAISANLTVDAGGTITLNGTTTVGGALDLQANANNSGVGGAISGTGIITITGTTTLETGTPATAANDITLNNAANDFIGSVTIISANDASLFDTGGIDIAAAPINNTLTINSTGPVTDSGNISVTNNARFTGSTITLGDAGGETTNFGSLTFNSVGAVVITEDTSTLIAGTNTALSLNLTSAAGISDIGATSTSVTNNTHITGSTIILGDAGTLFNTGSLTFTSAGAVNVAEDSGFDLTGASTAGQLTLTVVGDITESGTVTASDTSLTANAITMTTANALGNLTVFDGAGAVSITEADIIDVTAITHNTGNLILQASANIINVNGPIVITGGNAQFLTTTTLNLNDNVTATVISGTAVTVNVNNNTAQIQDGVDAGLLAGATVRVNSGVTFSEHVVVNNTNSTLVATVNTVTVNSPTANPALTVSGTSVASATGFNFTSTGPAADTISVTGGSLTLRNNFITESTTGSQAAIRVTGGALNLGATDDPGNNSVTSAGGDKLLVTSATVDASGNYWGTSNQATIAGQLTGTIDYTPYLNIGGDTSAAVGYQGNFTDLTVHAQNAQTAGGRITEGYNLLDATNVVSGTIHVLTGAYTDTVNLGATVATGPYQAADKAVIFNAGASPGQVTINGNVTFTSNDTLPVEINGLAQALFDNFTVNGTINLNGDNNAAGGANLVVTVGYGAVPYDRFTIFNNDSTEAVSGTFKNLPEGSVVTIPGGPRLRISYIEFHNTTSSPSTPLFYGDGNDISLTVMLPPILVTYDVLGNLTLDGTGRNDDITLAFSGTNQVTLIGNDVTNFTGPLTANIQMAGPYNVTGNLTIKLGNGKDKVLLRGVGGTPAIFDSGDLTIDLGSDDDTVTTIDNALVPVITSGLQITGNVSIIGGAGLDNVTLGSNTTTDTLTALNVNIDTGDGAGAQTISLDRLTSNGNVTLTNSGAGAQTVALGANLSNAPNSIRGNLIINQLASASSFTVGVHNTGVGGFVQITNGNGSGAAAVTLDTTAAPAQVVGGSTSITNGNNLTNAVTLTGTTGGLQLKGNVTIKNGAGTNSNQITITDITNTGTTSSSFTNGTSLANTITFGGTTSNSFLGVVAATNGVSTGTNTINATRLSSTKGINLTNGTATTSNTVAVGGAAATSLVNVTGNLVIANGAAGTTTVGIDNLTTNGANAVGNVTLTNAATGAGGTGITFGANALNAISGNLQITNQTSTGLRSVTMNRTTVSGRTGVDIYELGAGNTSLTVGDVTLVTISKGLTVQDGTGTSAVSLQNLTVGNLNYSDLGGGVDTIDIATTAAHTTRVNGVTRIDTGAASDIVTIATNGTAVFNDSVFVALGAGNDLLFIGVNAASPALNGASKFLFDGGAGDDTFNASPLSVAEYTGSPLAKKVKSKILNFEHLLMN